MPPALDSTRARASSVNMLSTPPSVIVTPVAALMSFVAPVFATVRSPFVVARLTEPSFELTPITPHTVVTVKPSASRNATFPFEVWMARFVTFVVVSVKLTAPRAEILKPATTIPPAVPVIVEPLVRHSTGTVPPPTVEAVVRLMSLLTVIAPLFESPMRNSPAVMRSSSSSLRDNGPPTVSVAEPRSIATLDVNCLIVTVPTPTSTTDVLSNRILLPMNVTSPSAV